MNDLSKDEKIALALTNALLQAKAGEHLKDNDLSEAYSAYKRLHKLIASSPESRAARGFSG